MWNEPKNNGKHITKNCEVEEFPRHDIFKESKTG
jgi:hypothetical protein